MNKTNNLRAYLRDLYEGIVSKKPDASRNPQNFRSEIEAIRTGGEFYEVMDESELPNDAPDGSLALVEGEPIPEAYTVSSIDELPIDAVDGSMAIVEDNSNVVQTWVLNDELPNLSESYDDWNSDDGAYSKFSIEFRSNSDSFRGFYLSMPGSSSWGIYSLYYEGKDTGTLIAAYTHNPGGNYGIAHGWVDEVYKTLLVTYADDEATAWLEAHGTKTGEKAKQTLYTHENGEWVYKCEVV